MAFDFSNHIGKRCAWYRRDDGRDTRLMPANTGIYYGHAGFFDGFGDGNDFIHGVAIGHQVNHRQTEGDNKRFSHRRTYRFDDFKGKTHTVF